MFFIFQNHRHKTQTNSRRSSSSQISSETQTLIQYQQLWTTTIIEATDKKVPTFPSTSHSIPFSISLYGNESERSSSPEITSTKVYWRKILIVHKKTPPHNAKAQMFTTILLKSNSIAANILRNQNHININYIGKLATT